MIKHTTYSDMGNIKIFNNELSCFFANGFGDGSNNIYIYPKGTKKRYDNFLGHFTITPDNETLYDIGTALIMASYELARPMGLGMMRDFDTILTKEMALKMLQGEDVSGDYAMNTNKPLKVYMDYVFGRCCKTLIEIIPQQDMIKLWISTVDRYPKAIIERAEELLKRT
jgi:hypothetical protein